MIAALRSICVVYKQLEYPFTTRGVQGTFQSPIGRENVTSTEYFSQPCIWCCTCLSVDWTQDRNILLKSPSRTVLIFSFLPYVPRCFPGDTGRVSFSPLCPAVLLAVLFSIDYTGRKGEIILEHMKYSKVFIPGCAESRLHSFSYCNMFHEFCP